MTRALILAIVGLLALPADAGKKPRRKGADTATLGGGTVPNVSRSSFCGSPPATVNSTPFVISTAGAGPIVDGTPTNRDVQASTPATITDVNNPMNLVIIYHEGGGTIANAQAWGMHTATGAQDNSVFVWPQGLVYSIYGVGWSPYCSERDYPMFDNILAWVGSHYCIDLNRVYVAGFSWGCDHAINLMSCRGDKIRAVSAASCTDEFATASDYTTYYNYPASPTNGAAIRWTGDASGADAYYASPYFSTTWDLLKSSSFCSCAGTTTAVDAACVDYDFCATNRQFRKCTYASLGHNRPATWAQDTWDWFASRTLAPITVPSLVLPAPVVPNRVPIPPKVLP